MSAATAAHTAATPIISSPFDVHAWLHDHPPPTCSKSCISQPVRLGNGWTKCDQEYSHNDYSGLPALQMPQLPFDLNEGIEDFQAKDPSEKAGVEILIREAKASGVPLDAENCHVLTFRNNLNKIFGTAFDDKQEWVVDGCLINNILFLDIVKTPDKWSLDPRNDLEKLRLMEKWGYQFEAKCVGYKAGNSKNEAGILIKTRLTPVDTTQTGAMALKSSATAGLRLFIGAEVDAYDPSVVVANTAAATDIVPPPLESLVEMKSMRPPTHPGQYHTLYRRKHPKIWLQSHLAGIQTVLLGMRDDQGIIRKIHKVATNDLVKISWENGYKWFPQQALALGADLLAWMRMQCSSGTGDGASGGIDDEESKHMRFSYEPETSKVTAVVVEGGDLPGRVAASLAE